MKQVMCPVRNRLVTVYPLRKTETKCYAEFPDKIKGGSYDDEHEILILGNSEIKDVHFVGKVTVYSSTITNCTVVNSTCEFVNAQDSTIVNCTLEGVKMTKSTVVESTLKLVESDTSVIIDTTLWEKEKASFVNHSILMQVSGYSSFHSAVLHDKRVSNTSHFSTYHPKQQL